MNTMKTLYKLRKKISLSADASTLYSDFSNGGLLSTAVTWIWNALLGIPWWGIFIIMGVLVLIGIIVYEKRKNKILKHENETTKKERDDVTEENRLLRKELEEYKKKKTLVGALKSWKKKK